jgi:hypothetical protein
MLHRVRDAVRKEMGMKQLVSSVEHCICTLVVGDQKVHCQAQLFFSISVTKKHSERTICECQGSHRKSNRGIEKWLPGLLSRALRTLAKVCLYPRKYLKEMLCK